MKKQLAIAAIMAGVCAVPASAQDFFSTQKCDRFMDLGVRVGVNTTNRTLGSDVYENAYTRENWGTGLDVGVVASLNVRDYLAIQPGFFYEYRYGSYTLMGENYAIPGAEASGYEVAQAGRRSSHNFTIPVLAVFRFNVASNVRWNVEVGPYVSFILSSTMSNSHLICDKSMIPPAEGGQAEFSPLFTTKPAPVDFGFKMGTGLNFCDHWNVSVHYMAGCIDAWKEQKIGSFKKDFGGVTKGWIFSVGYDF